MSFLREFLDFFLHLDDKLGAVIGEYQGWTYVILFLIIFLETGVVVTPFLPGDSLLFAAGTFCAVENAQLNVFLLFGLLAIAAISGDTLNYSIGKLLGKKVFERESRLIRKKHLLRTQEFYEKYGGKTIIISRFIPIIRTFAPFVAGIGTMNYGRFISFNVIGGIAWTAIFLFAGYALANVAWVRDNFSFITLSIIFISVLPLVVELGVQWRRSRKG